MRPITLLIAACRRQAHDLVGKGCGKPKNSANPGRNFRSKMSEDFAAI